MIQLLKKNPDSVQYLHKIRINPKLKVGKNQRLKLRADLEFYLPQLVAHYLRTDLTHSEFQQIRQFILLASEHNFFFAHKVLFNLRACLINKEENDKTIELIQEI